MDAHAAPHPLAADLRYFALGKLGDAARVEGIRHHLEGCPSCRSAVSEASGGQPNPRPGPGRPHSPAAPAAPGRAPRPGLDPTTLFSVPPELADHPDYELLRELGSGGMGVVYQARHRLSGRLEVLKVMNPGLLRQPGSRDRFLREIQSAARLDHKNVVKMHTAIERDGLLALVMEYVPGEDLAGLLKARGPLPVANACYYAQQAALGLQHAFEKGMVHRDIKPQNLMLVREGKKHVVKVLDFGLAKAAGGEEKQAGLTKLGAMMGTPEYMAPEQSLDAARADIRADVYSLGCTLYHLLAGSPPFSGRSAFEIVQAHHASGARPLEQLRADLPEGLAAVVKKMMAKEPAQRYQTPAEVEQALGPFVQAGLKPLAEPMPAQAERDTATARPMRETLVEGRATIARAMGNPPTLAPAKGGQRDTAPPRRQQTVIEVGPRVARRRKRGGGKQSVLWLIAALALVPLVGLLGAGAVLLMLTRPNASEGTQVVEVNQPADATPPPVQVPPDDPQREPKVPVVQPPNNGQGFADLFHVAATPTANWVAWTAKHGESWQLMDPPRIKYPPFEGHTDAVLSIAFNGDGKRMLTGSADRTVRLWSPDDGQKPLHTFEGHTKPVTSVAISPDGRWGASADGGPEVSLWDLEKKERLHTLSHPRGVRSLSFSPSGEVVLCGLERPDGPGDNDFCSLWKVATGDRWARIGIQVDQAVTALALSADERFLAAGGKGMVWLGDLGRKGKRKRQVTLRPTALGANSGAVRHLAFSKDSQRYLVSLEKGVFLLGVGGQVHMRLERPDKDQLCACFSADEQKIFLAQREGSHLPTELLNIPAAPPVAVKPPPPPPPFVPRPKEKLAVPARAEVAAAREKVRQEYKADYALLKKDASGKAAGELVMKLIQRGGKQEEEPLYRYALLREAYDLAVGKQDLWQAFWAVTVMDNAFAISPLAERAAAVEAIAHSPEAQRHHGLMDKTLEVVEEAIGEDDYVRADRLMSIAAAAAQHNHSVNTQALVLQRSRRLQALCREYKRVEAAVKKLARDPDDGDACLAVGRFQCFHKGDWQRGLPLLEKGSDKLLALIARGERGVGEDTRNQLGFGDMWWEQADKDAPNREAIRERARYWYCRALPKLEGDDKARAEKRLSLPSKAGPLKPGLVAEIFADNNLKNKVASRVDYQIDFKWGTGSPHVQVPAEAFSVRWTGWLMVPESGYQHLHTFSKGGFRIWLDGKLLNDQWNTKGGNYGNGLDMAAGLHLFQVEYRKTDVPAEINLRWSHPPGKKAGMIPIELLYHDRQQEKSLDLAR